MKGVEAPSIGALVRAVVVVVVVLFFWWFLLAWVVIRRPILVLQTAAFIALVVLIGIHDAQALAIYR